MVQPEMVGSFLAQGGHGGAPCKSKDRIQIQVPVDDLPQMLEKPRGKRIFLRCHEAQVARWYGKFGIFRKAADQRQLRRAGGQRLSQYPFVVRACHVVEDHPGNSHPGVEAGEAVHQRGRAARLAAGIHHQEYGSRERLRDLGRAPRLGYTVDPVEEPHHPFDDRDVGPFAVVGEAGADEPESAHPAIQVHRNGTGHQPVVAGIDEIRADLVGRHPEATSFQGIHDAKGQGRLSGAALRCCDDYPLHEKSVPQTAPLIFSKGVPHP
jgi:hypothetical protein